MGVLALDTVVGSTDSPNVVVSSRLTSCDRSYPTYVYLRCLWIGSNEGYIGAKARNSCTCKICVIQYQLRMSGA